ncbi:MAG: sulfotransferase family 2 domain-containing protein [Pirellulales bacterium]
MIVSRQHQFIFIANGKTGTTSLEHALSDLHDQGTFVGACPGLFDAKHVPARVLRELVGHSFWNKCFKFGFVRNPWDRLVSVYHHIRRDTQFNRARFVRHPRSTVVHFIRARKYALPDTDRFDTSLIMRMYEIQKNKRMCLAADSAFQYSMFADEHENLIVDFIGRYESLEEDIRKIESRLNLPGIKLPRLNTASKRNSYRSYYDPEGRELVAKLYAKDVEMFGYDF